MSGEESKIVKQCQKKKVLGFPLFGGKVMSKESLFFDFNFMFLRGQRLSFVCIYTYAHSFCVYIFTYICIYIYIHTYIVFMCIYFNLTHLLDQHRYSF